MTRWIVTASLLFSLSAAAQQGPSSAQPAAARPVAVQPTSSNTPGLAVAQQAARTPVSEDQVIDQIIEREHALISFLSNRKPIVETYLQNLAPDTKLGAVPKEDHYFLGRLDMGESIERRDFLEICEDRYQIRSLVLTSQLPVAKWHAQIGDPTLADSILDRLVHNAHRIEMQGESMRKKRGGKEA